MIGYKRPWRLEKKRN